MYFPWKLEQEIDGLLKKIHIYITINNTLYTFRNIKLTVSLHPLLNGGFFWSKFILQTKQHAQEIFPLYLNIPDNNKVP